jgi:hypothetical protein
MKQIRSNVSRMPVYFINPSIKSTPLKSMGCLKVIHQNLPIESEENDENHELG